MSNGERLGELIKRIHPGRDQIKTRIKTGSERSRGLTKRDTRGKNITSIHQLVNKMQGVKVTPALKVSSKVTLSPLLATTEEVTRSGNVTKNQYLESFAKKSLQR